MSDEKLRATIEKVPIKWQSLTERAYAGTGSKSNAIKAKCLECVGYEDAKENVGGCKCFSCPLWAYRPYQAKEPGSETGAEETLTDEDDQE